MKDAVGSGTGETKTQAEGKMDKAKGSAQSAAGGAKDAVRDATDQAGGWFATACGSGFGYSACRRDAQSF